MFKDAIGTIKVPQKVVNQIAGLFLPKIEEWVEQSLLELEDGSGYDLEDDSGYDSEDLDEDQLYKIMAEYIRENEYSYEKMPYIDLKNVGAQEIFNNTRIYLDPNDNAKGYILPISPTEAKMALNPIGILEDIDLANDHLYVMRQFERDFKDTIRHEVIHAIHFAYEHAPLLDHIAEPEMEEDDFIDQDEDFTLYNQHSYTDPRTKKVKTLPWDTEKNLKLNPHTNYHNNRFEIETWPSNMASHVLREITKDLKGTTPLHKLEYVTGLLEQQSNLSKLIKENEHTLYGGRHRVIDQISLKNKKKFYTKTLKQLTYLLEEYQAELQEQIAFIRS